MKILFVDPAAEISISDVSRGYRAALERQGHDIRDYNTKLRFEYHRSAMPPEVRNDTSSLSRQATENILNEALYHEADLVIIISGLNIHPVALWSLTRVGIPVAVVLTESPYDDPEQKLWASLSGIADSSKNVTMFTNDRYSADLFEWKFLPPAFDPAIHKPVELVEEEVCDVLIVGTGWRERQAFLEAVNWEGVNLRIYGVWPTITPDSPIFKYHIPLVVDNARIAKLYCSTKICLNFHRVSDVAVTPGPRAYEIAACKAFMLSDPREGLEELFGDSVPTFRGPVEFEALIHKFLADDEQRKSLAEQANLKVQNETFDQRASTLISEMSLLQGA